MSQGVWKIFNGVGGKKKIPWETGGSLYWKWEIGFLLFAIRVPAQMCLPREAVSTFILYYLFYFIYLFIFFLMVGGGKWKKKGREIKDPMKGCGKRYTRV